MTVRERFHKVMNADPTVSKGPVIEWATWWDKTIDCWKREGLPSDLDNQQLFSHFGLDHHFQLWPGTVRPDCPSRKTENMVPIIINDENDYERLKHYFYPQESIDSHEQLVLKNQELLQSGDTLFWYTLEGFFWFPRKLFGDVGQLYAFYDYPELYHRICKDLLEWQLRYVHTICRHVKPDFMTIAEDMSYNNGPLLSGDHFREFILPYYQILIPQIKQYGTKVFIDSDGDVSMMLPWLMEAGVEGVLPLERQAGVDLAAYRKSYPDFMFIGGFDKMTLLQGKDAIRNEFERLLPVIESGRYIPSVDHQTPPGTTLENYKYYVELLHQYSEHACKKA